MTSSPRLRFLADTVIAEAEHLQTTDGRLFAVAMTPERAASLRTELPFSDLISPLWPPQAGQRQPRPTPNQRALHRCSRLCRQARSE